MNKNKIRELSSVAVEFMTDSGIQMAGLSNINETRNEHFLIYKITNQLNGKHYIGQHHTTNPYDRYMGSGELLYQAKQLYGISAFVKEILFDFDTFELMNEKEAELVQLSNCVKNDPMSYNLIPGGVDGISKLGPLSESTKQKLSKIFTGTHRTQETREKISRSTRGKKKPPRSKQHCENIGKAIRKNGSVAGKNNGCYGRKWMHHPITQKKVYPKSEDVDYYLSLGYIFGVNDETRNKNHGHFETDKTGKRIKFIPAQLTNTKSLI